MPHIECCNFGVAVLHNLLYILGGCFSQVTIVTMMFAMIKAISSRRILSETMRHVCIRVRAVLKRRSIPSGSATIPDLANGRQQVSLSLVQQEQNQIVEAYNASAGTMVRERCRFSLTECGGKLYAIGGCSEIAALEDDVSVEW